MFKRILLSVILFITALNCFAEPRGIRTNNPMNIISTSIKWDGEVKCADKVNECFVTPYYGLKAAARQLDVYYHKYNLRTAEEIVRHLGPRGSKYSTTMTNYVNFVRSKAGYAVEGSDYREYLFKLLKAVIHFENGHNPYADSLIWRAIQTATATRYSKYSWECNHHDSFRCVRRPKYVKVDYISPKLIMTKVALAVQYSALDSCEVPTAPSNVEKLDQWVIVRWFDHPEQMKGLTYT